MNQLIKAHSMKKNILAFVIAASGQAAMAGTVAGFGGGTEFTQLANQTQLILQYEQQVQAYLRQGQHAQEFVFATDKRHMGLLEKWLGRAKPVAAIAAND